MGNRISFHSEVNTKRNAAAALSSRAAQGRAFHAIPVGRKVLVIWLLTFPFLVPIHTFGKAASAGASFIDTTMPSSIPDAIVIDWEIQDSAFAVGFGNAVARIKSKLSPKYSSKVDTGSSYACYVRACHWRRVARMENYSQYLKRLLCCRGNFYFGVGFSGTTSDRSALALITFDDYYPTPVTILEERSGVIRNPCVSFNGKKIAFSWLRDTSGCHIFEMNADTPTSVRQLTHNLPGNKVFDFEPCYLPNGDILFNSTRCFQGCAAFPVFGEVNNLFIMNRDGRYLRRICYDQAHNCNPSVMSDGKIMFSRWEFNDRNPFNVFGVFSMNPDGTIQNEYFGNQLTWPNTFPYVREIPGSGGKFLAIITEIVPPSYTGDLVVVDPTKGRNSLDAIQLVAPKRPLPENAASLRGMSHGATLSWMAPYFQAPYPLDEDWFLVSYSGSRSTATRFTSIYFMNVNGDRELIAWDTNQGISQPFPLWPREASRLACKADYTKTTSEVAMTNAYYGTGIDSTIKPGAIKKVRVIALEYRANQEVGYTGGAWPGTSTPLSRSYGSVESKRIVGEMKVESDGSAAFVVPARTPLYLQLIDSLGCMQQSMRSWMTLQPGERFDCTGCHENKNGSPPPAGTPLASTPKTLEPFCGIADGFLRYPDIIQPILDAKCVSCHGAGHSSGLDLTGLKIWTGNLVQTGAEGSAQRYWCTSYLNLTDSAKGLVSYMTTESPAEGLKPNTVGSGKSKLIAKLREHSGAMKEVSPSEKEMAILCAWIDLCIPHGGKYTDDMKSEDARLYEQSLLPRKQEEEFEARNIAEFIRDGGYDNVAYGGTIQGVIDRGNTAGREAVGGRNFQIRFSRHSRRLTMILPSAGSVTLVDLKGRRMAKFDISDNDYLHYRGTACRALAAGVPAGLYVAKFKGKAGSVECVFFAP